MTHIHSEEHDVYSRCPRLMLPLPIHIGDPDGKVPTKVHDVCKGHRLHRRPAEKRKPAAIEHGAQLVRVRYVKEPLRLDMHGFRDL